jgi:hypothetical protein
LAGKSVTLSGWKAVVVLLFVGGFVAFRAVTSHAQLDTQGRAALERWVQAEVERPILADTTRSMMAKDSALQLASTVKIKSIGVRGLLTNAIVRIELAPSPALPPGTKLVRYYHMQYSSLTGWSHHGTAYAWDWYLAAF